jgi:hypothetical protein
VERRRQEQIKTLARVAGIASAVAAAGSAYASALGRHDFHMADLERQRLGILTNRLDEAVSRGDALALLLETPAALAEERAT